MTATEALADAPPHSQLPAPPVQRCCLRMNRHVARGFLHLSFSVFRSMFHSECSPAPVLKNCFLLPRQCSGAREPLSSSGPGGDLCWPAQRCWGANPECPPVLCSSLLAPEPWNFCLNVRVVPCWHLLSTCLGTEAGTSTPGPAHLPAANYLPSTLMECASSLPPSKPVCCGQALWGRSCRLRSRRVAGSWRATPRLVAEGLLSAPSQARGHGRSSLLGLPLPQPARQEEPRPQHPGGAPGHPAPHPDRAVWPHRVNLGPRSHEKTDLGTTNNIHNVQGERRLPVSVARLWTRRELGTGTAAGPRAAHAKREQRAPQHPHSSPSHSRPVPGRLRAAPPRCCSLRKMPPPPVTQSPGTAKDTHSPRNTRARGGATQQLVGDKLDQTPGETVSKQKRPPPRACVFSPSLFWAAKT